MSDKRDIPQRGFHLGEASPKALGRIDREEIGLSCRELKNSMLDRDGAAFKRNGFGIAIPQDQTSGTGFNAVIANTTKRIVPFAFGDEDYVLHLAWTGSAMRMRQFQNQGSSNPDDVSASDTDADGVANEAYWEFDGWLETDADEMQYAQVSDRIYFFSGTAPMHVFRKGVLGDFFVLEKVGDPAAVNRAPGPPVRAFAPPFAITVFDDTTTETPDVNAAEVDQQSLVAGRPLFRAADAETSSTGDPAIYLLNDKGRMFFYRVLGYDTPRKVDAVAMGNFETPDDGVAVADWFGPWKRDSAMEAAINVSGDFQVDNTTGVGTGDLAEDTAVTISWTTTGIDFEPGDIIWTQIPSMPSYSSMLVVLSVNQTLNNGIARVIQNNGSTKLQDEDSIGGSEIDEIQVWRPELRLDDLNLFIVHQREEDAIPSNSLEDKYIRDLRGELPRRDGSTFRTDVTIGGGWIQIGTTLNSYSADLMGIEYEDIDFPDDVQLLTATAQIRANEVDGFPSTGTFHQNRLVCCGFPGAPLSLAMSATGLYDDWSVGPDADDALLILLEGDLGERLRWAKSAGDLLIGTENTEFAISGQPITPTSLGNDQQTTYGARSVQAIQAGPAVLFVGRAGRTLRESQFRFETDSRRSPDLARYAEHLFEQTAAGYNGMKRVQFLSSPEPTVVALRDDGTLVAMGYNSETGVFGWSEWPMSHTVVDICVSRQGDFDELWAIVLDSPSAALVRIREQARHFLDEHVVVTPSGGGGDEIASSAIPAILSGETVRVVDIANASGYPEDLGSYTATGTITLNSVPNGDVVFGLPYSWRLKARVPEASGNRKSTEGEEKQHSSVKALLHNTPYLRMNGSVVRPARTGSEAPDEEWVQSREMRSTVSSTTTPLLDSNLPYPCKVSATVLETKFDEVN